MPLDAAIPCSRIATAYDTTKFLTHVTTTNERNTLAQRGHNKQGRDNLRQLGLALGKLTLA